MSDFFADKKVLVAGGAGFVGSHFVEALLERGARVRVTLHERPLRLQHERIETVRADLYQLEDCRRACAGADYVVHAAGAVSAAGVTAHSPMGPIAANLIMSVQLLQAAWLEGVERFLLFSSSTGYPALDHPVREEEFWSGPPHPAYFGYGWMRRYLERLGEFVQQRSDTRIALIRPTAVYGRYDDFDPETSHVVPALIRRAVAKENPFVVWGRGDVVRDFLHITDLVRGSLLVLEKRAECDPVNIGCGQAVTVADLVRIILDAAGHRGAEVVFDESKPTTIPFRMADTTKARRLLGFEPTVPLEEGLRDTVEWYKSTLDACG